MYKLYVEAMLRGKPYRIHKVRQLYSDYLNQVTKQFAFITLDSLESWELLLGPLPVLKELIKKKQSAVSGSDYESAAEIRDQEKTYIRLKMHQSGMSNEDRYFCKDGNIYSRL